MNTLVLARLERIEKLCFEDEPGRTSLATLARRIDAHVTALTDYANAAKFLFAISANLIALAMNWHTFVRPLM